MKPNIRRIWRFFPFFFLWVSKILHRWIVSFLWAEPIKPYYNFFFFLTPGDWKPSKPLLFRFYLFLNSLFGKNLASKTDAAWDARHRRLRLCVVEFSLSLSSSLPRHRQPFKSPFCSISLERNSDSEIQFFLRFLVHISVSFCLRKNWCDRSRKYTLLIIITTRSCVFLVEQEGKGGVPGLSLLAFFFFVF
jgi:hypothetical protein